MFNAISYNFAEILIGNIDVPSVFVLMMHDHLFTNDCKVNPTSWAFLILIGRY